MRNRRKGGDEGGKEAHQCYHFNNDGGCRWEKNPIGWNCVCAELISRLMQAAWELMGHGCWFLKLGGWRFEYFILVKKVN